MKAQVPYILVAFFLITQFIGLYIGNQYIQLINTGEASRPFEGTPLGNPEAVTTSLYLFGYIIVSTVIILLIIRIRKSTIRILEVLIVFIASWFTLDLLFPLDIGFLSLGFFLALALTAWKALRPNIVNQDIAAILSGAFVGSSLGVSLGILPSPISIESALRVFAAIHGIASPENWTPKTEKVSADQSFRKSKCLKSDRGPIFESIFARIL